MLPKIGGALSAWARRWVPDPFLFAILLTGLALVLAYGATPSTTGEVVAAWGKGFWELLAFGMQMCLVLVTGHALAVSGPVRRGIAALASIPRRGGEAAALVAGIACLTGLLNWGLAIIVGALAAREVAVRGEEKGRRFHYPLLAAAGYTGLLVWHGGLSGSAPLLVATKGHFLEAEMGVLPIAQTLFTPLNVVVALALLALIPLLCAFLHPADGIKTAGDFGVGRESARESGSETDRRPIRWLENTRALSAGAGLLGAVYLVHSIRTDGFQPDLNLVNLAFLSLGLLLHASPRGYLEAVADGARACAGIILQFPFYAGIMGVMKYTGLMSAMAAGLSENVGPTLYPVATFLSAGLVNLFVPSGGGQWAVQGPIAVEAARLLDVPLPRALLAVAYGDEWTNMFQPFWALALLGITRLRAADIMGYTILFLVVSLPVFVLGLLLLPV